MLDICRSAASHESENSGKSSMGKGLEPSPWALPGLSIPGPPASTSNVTVETESSAREASLPVPAHLNKAPNDEGVENSGNASLTMNAQEE